MTSRQTTGHPDQGSTHTNAEVDAGVVGVDHVQVAMPAGAEDQARAFYHGVLGLPEVPKPATLAARGGVWFRCGAQMIHLGVERGFAPARKAHPALLVRDLAPFRAHVLAAGYKVQEDEALPGYDRFYTADPFGNRLEFLSPQPTGDGDESAATTAIKDRVRAAYSAAADAYVTSPSHAKGPDLQRLLDLVAPQSGERALDLSTGGGHVALALAQHDAEVTAVDLTPTMLAAARAHIRSSGIESVAYVVGDAEHLPFLDATFDLVTIRIAPHHYASVPAALREVARVLVPGGRLGLIDNIVPEDAHLGEAMNDWERRRDPSHVRALPLSEWQTDLVAAGLRVSALEVGRKRHPFDEWTTRTGMVPAEREALERDMLADPSAREYFAVEAANGRVLAWQCDYVVLRAERE